MFSGLLKKYLARQAFIPGRFGIFFNPYFIARRGLLVAIEKCLYAFKGGTLLDVGCGVKPYRELFGVDKYWGVDVQGGGHSDGVKDSDIFYDGVSLPVKALSVDSVISTQVIEHISSPAIYLSEIHRVLKPGGMLLLTAPLLFGEHEKPYDFFRYTSYGIKHILIDAGFDIKEQFKSTTYVESVFQMISAYVDSLYKGQNRYIRLMITMLISSIIQLTGILFSSVLPVNDDLYLDNIVLAVKR